MFPKGVVGSAAIEVIPGLVFAAVVDDYGFGELLHEGVLVVIGEVGPVCLMEVFRLEIVSLG